MIFKENLKQRQAFMKLKSILAQNVMLIMNTINNGMKSNSNCKIN